MAYKTILLHLNDPNRAASLLQVAAPLVRQSSAHLIGCFVMPSVKVFGSSSYGTGMVRGYVAKLAAEAVPIQRAFELACRDQGFASEWRQIDAGNRSAVEAVIDLGRSVDLIIASQRDPDGNYGVVIDEPERLAIESGRPVLFVPCVGQFPTVGRRILIAWNGRREAARAVFDALPLLKRADLVRVLWIHPNDEPRPAGDISTADIVAALARHGVSCEVAATMAGDRAVADTLLARIAEEDADLLVMGAYGHSRIMEFVLGGATRDVLAQMTVPVLMSH